MRNRRRSIRHHLVAIAAVIVVLAIALFSALAQALPNCKQNSRKGPPSEECCNRVKLAWENDYYDAYEISEPRWPRVLQSCAGEQYLLAEALYYLEHLEFVNGPNFAKILRDGIGAEMNGVGLINYGGFSDKHAAHVTDIPKDAKNPLGIKNNIVLLSPFFDADIANRMSMLVHESRHFLPTERVHTTCNHGYYAGHELGCDAVYTPGGGGGAFSFQMYFYLWLKGNYNSGIETYKVNGYIRDLIDNRFDYVAPQDRANIYRILGIKDPLLQ